MTLPSPILTALGYDADGLQQFLKPVFAEGARGEAYFSNSTSRHMTITDKQVQAPVMNMSAGGALRRIYGLRPDFVSFTGLTAENLKLAKADLMAIPLGSAQKVNAPIAGALATAGYYKSHEVFAGKTNDDCKRLLQEIDDYARSADKRVTQVTATLVGEGTDILIARADGKLLSDYRPYLSLRIEVVMTENGRRESGAERDAKRLTWDTIFAREYWQRMADRAIEMAKNNLESIPAPSGNHLDIVVSNGVGGVILHEAFGHGLEADFHMKGMASLQGKLGQRVAAKGVNIVETGTVPEYVGSLNFDDEGNPTRDNLLVEDGILLGLITDEISAAALNMPLTGNGRRESFSHTPMPRMTNTRMLPGTDTPESLISDVKHGIYCSSFSGGEVNITSGKFVFVANEARLIENGKLGAFVKGASLQGMGNTAYLAVDGVANNAADANGFCGKRGQTVPVTLGQPTIRLRAGEIIVGGTGA